MRRIQRIERNALTLITLGTLVSSFFVGDPRVTLGVAIGGSLELVNFTVLRRLIQRIIDGVSPEKGALIALALAGKFVWLGLSIFLCIRYLPVNGTAFTVGVTLVIVAMVLEAFLPSPEKRR